MQRSNEHLEEPHSVIQVDRQSSCKPTPARVELMFEAIKRTLPGRPRFLLCILPERKNLEIYGPWKRRCLVEDGIVTQCILHSAFYPGMDVSHGSPGRSDVPSIAAVHFKL